MALADVVFLLPGISGSVLSRGGKEIWGTGAGGILRALSSLGGSIRQLELPPEALDDEDFDDGIEATGLVQDLHLLPGLWKIDGYTKLTNYIVSTLGLRRGENYFEFPYDWRLDNRRAAKALECRAHDALKAWRARSGNDDAKLILVAHSMGGLVARHFIECLEGWKETRALVTFGTPYRGSLNALGFLCNGFAKGIGPLKLDLSSTLRSMDSVYQLLPTFRCVDVGDRGLMRVKEAVNLPNVDALRADRAAAFHSEIADARAENMKDESYHRDTYRIFPVVGTFQPTWLSAHVEQGQVTLLRTRDGQDHAGDGTVPRGSALPPEETDMSRGTFTEDLHGSMQNVDNVLAQLRGALTGLEIEDSYRDRGFDLLQSLDAVPRLGLLFDDVYAAEVDNELVVEPAVIEDGRRVRGDAGDVVGEIVDLRRQLVVETLPFRRDVDDLHRADFNLPAGEYRIHVSAAGPAAPVTDTFVVAEG